MKELREESLRDEESEPEPTPEPVPEPALARGRLAWKEKQSLSGTVMMNPWMATKLIVPSNLLCIDHGHLKHTGAGWEDRIVNGSTVRYHSHMRPDNVFIRDVVFYGLQGAVKFEELSDAEEVGHAGNTSVQESTHMNPVECNSDTESAGGDQDSPSAEI